jgi:protein SCO1/2
MTRRSAFLLALALMLFPALAAPHDAGADKRLPVIGPAPPFTLTSQDRKSVALADLRGKVLAVTFIYTGCPDICPLVTQKMVDVQNALGSKFGAKIASFRSPSTRSTTRPRY